MAYVVLGEALYPHQEEKRLRYQNDLKHILEYINSIYRTELADLFELVSENEFRGALRSGSHLLEILDIIQFRFPSVSVRFGIGIESSIYTEQAGVCAAQALEALRKKNDYQVSKTLIMSEEEADWFSVVNESLHLCDYLQGRWKSLQSMIMEATILKTGYGEPTKQTELADLFKTSKQNINRAIRGMGYYQFIRTKREIQNLMTQKWG